MNTLITFIHTFIEVVISLVIGHAARRYSPSCSQQEAQRHAQTSCSDPVTEVTTAGYVSFSQATASSSLSAAASTATLILAMLLQNPNVSATFLSQFKMPMLPRLFLAEASDKGGRDSGLENTLYQKVIKHRHHALEQLRFHVSTQKEHREDKNFTSFPGPKTSLWRCHHQHQYCLQI